jgi:hypothetical protein
MSVANRNRSSMRKCERPADVRTNGSGGAMLVHAVGRYRSSPPVITKADAVFSPSEVLVYEPELASVEGVKDMRNQEGLRPIKRYECS